MTVSVRHYVDVIIDATTSEITVAIIGAALCIVAAALLVRMLFHSIATIRRPKA